MEITEQENGKGAVGRTRHLAISRKDTLINDLKNSTAEGFLSMGAGIASLLLSAFTLLYSFRRAGGAGYEAGVLCFLSFVLGVLAVVFGAAGKRNRTKIRHTMEKRGIRLGLLMIILLIALYLRGAVTYGGS